MYNPYDLLNIIIDGNQAYARPIAFDSDIVDHKNLKNAFGTYVKPNKIVTTCPKCGQGVQLDILLEEPPFPPYVCSCPNCYPKKAAMVDPFKNPIKSKSMTLEELDPLYHNIGQMSLDIPSSTVQERLKDDEEDVNKKVKPKPKKKDKPKKVEEVIESESDVVIPENNSSRTVPPALNTEMGQECDFDDNDLVEP